MTGPDKRIARDVVIDHTKSHVTIDGHEFPYHVAPDFKVTSSDNDVTLVHLAIMADNATVITAEGREEYPSPWVEQPAP